MNKIIAFLTILVLTLALVSCSASQGTSEAETIENSLLPAYVPGSIKLTPIEYLDEYPFKVTKREIYYSISSVFEELVYPDAADEVFGDYKNPDGIEPIEMRLVTFLKHFNIPKEDFIKATERLKEIRLKNDMDIGHEEYELPNADIIYTFDNEIINAYFRRENPVAPDWAKVKTYESYAEYQKAKG